MGQTRRWGSSALVLLAFAACGETRVVGGEPGTGDTSDAGEPDGGAPQPDASFGLGPTGAVEGGTSVDGPAGSGAPLPQPPFSTENVCERAGVCVPLAAGNLDKVDLLFAVDNSGSMAEEQAALRNVLPKLIRVLASGDRENGAAADDFAPVASLHLGVVSSDLGLVGISGIDLCGGLGDEGRLLSTSTTDPAVQGCNPMGYPKFLTFDVATDDPALTANDLACISTLGTLGCGFEQQLESALKALWPANDDRIVFLSDPVTSFGEFGQGGEPGVGGENAGFLRSDPAQGQSLVAIVMLTDEEDCSSQNLSHFRPPQFLDPNVPADQQLAMQGLNVRCHFNPQNLFSTARYINGLRQLRPGNEELVLFAAIVGVPPDAVEQIPEGFATDPAARSQFYAAIRNHPLMQPAVETLNTPDPQDDQMRPSCDTAMGRAFPPNRIVDVAEGFGANGVVQSICQEDLGPAFDVILDRLQAQLGPQCLQRPLTRTDERVAACDVVWALPPPSASEAGTPVTCAERPFLIETNRRTAAGGALCNVVQLGVRQTASAFEIVPVEIDGTTHAQGWYYDDFSPDALACRSGSAGRVAYTDAARPPTGVRAYLDCGS